MSEALSKCVNKWTKVDKYLGLFQKVITTFEKLFLFYVPMDIQKDWKPKSESAYSFYVKVF